MLKGENEIQNILLKNYFNKCKNAVQRINFKFVLNLGMKQIKSSKIM